MTVRVQEALLMLLLYHQNIETRLYSLVLTYDKSTVTCIKLPADILHKTATYGTDIYQTLWTINKDQIKSSIDNSSSSSIRLLAVSADSYNCWCVVVVKHGSNDIDIMQADSDNTIKHSAYIKGSAITEHTDVVGAIVLHKFNRTLLLKVAYKHDNTIRVYDTVDALEICKPISIGISGDSIADVFIDTYIISVFTTSTWLPSVHCWSLYASTTNSGQNMIDAAIEDITQRTRAPDGRPLPYTFTKLLACIQQYPPTILENLNSVKWCAVKSHLTLLALLLDPINSPIAKGKLLCYM
jgi:WD40 repeat protein